jgi:hypothetical protein
MSRIIFPFVFTCLNVLYWAGFIYYFWNAWRTPSYALNCLENDIVITFLLLPCVSHWLKGRVSEWVNGQLGIVATNLLHQSFQ